ncbi:MAG: GntR family transcriptional regulator [Peptostreptococcaceae bacterium]
MKNWMDEFVNNTDLSQNRPIREVVYDSLRSTLISGRVPVGERIIEKEYAHRLNISRTPVRDALKILEMEGLVEYIPRLGVVAKSVTRDDVIEIYKIRQSLEILIVTNAMENITQDEIDAIDNNLEQTEKMNAEDNTEEVIRLFGEFNSLVYKASKMKRLPSIISNLNNYLQRFRNISILDRERRDKALLEHRTILEALKTKDLELLSSTTYTHLEDSLVVVLNEIDK